MMSLHLKYLVGALL